MFCKREFQNRWCRSQSDTQLQKQELHCASTLPWEQLETNDLQTQTDIAGKILES